MFFDNLKVACAKKKTSPTALLKSLGMSTSSVTSWKKGVVPSLKTVYQLAEALKIDPAVLLDTTGEYFGEGKEKAPTPEDERKFELSPAFFRLKQGLEPYDISEDDADFLLDVYKAHIKKNHQG